MAMENPGTTLRLDREAKDTQNTIDHWRNERRERLAMQEAAVGTCPARGGVTMPSGRTSV